MKPHKFAPAHPFEAEDRASGAYDVVVVVAVCLFAAYVVTKVWSHQ